MAIAVEILEPNFEIQNKIGGNAKSLMGPKIVAKANEVLETFVPPLRKEVVRLLEEIAREAKERKNNSNELIWSYAHELRGLAGMAKYVKLGQISDILCKYLSEAPEGFKPDANLLTTITITALHTLKEGSDSDKMVDILVNDCSLASMVQKRREGRLI